MCVSEGCFRLFSLIINCEQVMFWLELAAAFIIDLTFSHFEARAHMCWPLCCEHVLVILAWMSLGVLSPSYLQGSCDKLWFFSEQMLISQASFRVRVMKLMKTSFTAALVQPHKKLLHKKKIWTPNPGAWILTFHTQTLIRTTENPAPKTCEGAQTWVWFNSWDEAEDKPTSCMEEICQSGE